MSPSFSSTSSTSSTSSSSLTAVTKAPLHADAINQRRFLPLHYQPTATDVLCGKGKQCFNHPGNRRFRAVVNSHLQRYQAAPTKLDKTAIVNKIVQKIRKDCTGGGFVRPDSSNNRWFDIGDEAAREKVGQVIRDAMLKQDPDGLQKKLHKRKARATERRERKSAEYYDNLLSKHDEQGQEHEQGQEQDNKQVEDDKQVEPKITFIKRPKYSGTNQNCSKTTLPVTTLSESFITIEQETKTLGQPNKMIQSLNILRSKRVPLVGTKAPAKMKCATQKTPKIGKPEKNPTTEEKDPVDFYETLRRIYQEQEITGESSVSTYSGKDTADETSDISDEEFVFFEEVGENAIFV